VARRDIEHATWTLGCDCHWSTHPHRATIMPFRTLPNESDRTPPEASHNGTSGPLGNASSGLVDQLYEVDHSDRSIAPVIEHQRPLRSPNAGNPAFDRLLQGSITFLKMSVEPCIVANAYVVSVCADTGGVVANPSRPASLRPVNGVDLVHGIDLGCGGFGGTGVGFWNERGD
jgi:hypothetical protein